MAAFGFSFQNSFKVMIFPPSGIFAIIARMAALRNLFSFNIFVKYSLDNLSFLCYHSFNISVNC